MDIKNINIIKFVEEFKIEKIDINGFYKKNENKAFSKDRIELFNKIVNLTKNDNEELFNHIIDFLNHESELIFLLNLTSLIDKNANPESKIYKLFQISSFYETAQLLKFPLFIKNGKKIEIGKSYNKGEILSKLKFLGITDKDLKLINKLRNAFFHPYQIENNKLFDNKNIFVCNLDEIDKIHSKVMLVNKFMSETLMSIFRYNPMFLNLIFAGLHSKHSENVLKFKTYKNLFNNIKLKVNNEYKITEEDRMIEYFVRNFISFFQSPIQTLKGLFHGMIIKRALNKYLPIEVSKEEVKNFKKEVKYKLFDIGITSIMKSKKYNSHRNKESLKSYGVFLIKFAKEKFKD